MLRPCIPLLLALLPALALAAPEIRPVDEAWRAALPLEAAQATQAYLDRLPPDAVARANAYFEGGYWLQLGNWLQAVFIALLLLNTRASAALRDVAGRRLKRPMLRDACYGAVYFGTVWLLSLPLAIYEGFVREHAYGLANQGFGDWFGEQLIGLGLSLVLGAIGVSVLYAVLRKVGRNWWAWAGGLAVAFTAFVMVIDPVFIAPLTNDYQPMADGPLKQKVLALALAKGVAADEVYVVDASRQSSRVSANVSGLFGTARISLNDNLLKRGSEAEVLAVLGHELGHYVLDHALKGLFVMSLLVVLGLRLTQAGMQGLLARYGARWRVSASDDVASFPLLSVLLVSFMFFALPLENTIVRTEELQADRFGLDAAREPLGMAEVMLKLTEYRKPDPTVWEERLFFDHPGTRTRIQNAMQWREQMAR